MSKLENCELRVVGQYNSKFNDILGISLPCADIFQSDGLIVHIKHRHPDYLPYEPSIPDILESPDYIGCHPKEANSIELVKRLEENILVAIKLDPDEQYLYISSLYDIKESKLQRRINSGRLKIFK